MSLKFKTLSMLALISLLAACDRSSSTGDGNEAGGDGGPMFNTNLVALTSGNARELSEYSAQRLNMVTSEVFRTLRRLYRDPMDVVVDLNQRMADSNNPAANDPFDPSYCLSGVEIVRFSDVDTNNVLNAGDEILFFYSSSNCMLSASTDFGPAPSDVSGAIRFTFTDDSTPAADPRRFVGTASFENYGYSNGVLAFRASAADSITSGQVDFDITFGPADATATFISTGGVELGSGTADLALPVNLSFDSVSRTRAAGTTTLVLDNVVAASAVSELRALLATGAPIVSPDDAYPIAGSLLLVGGSSSVLIEANVGPLPVGSEALTVTQIDANGDGSFANIDFADWNALITQFLIPGTTIPASPPP